MPYLGVDLGPQEKVTSWAASTGLCQSKQERCPSAGRNIDGLVTQ